ncbi:MAG: YHS domain-containing protein [Bryobacteraceae bacterium]
MRILAWAVACLLLAGAFGCSGPRVENTTAPSERTAGGEQARPAKAVEIDPVCGMEIDPAEAAGKSEYKGKTYFFCSDHCEKTFEMNPEVALSRRSKSM